MKMWKVYGQTLAQKNFDLIIFIHTHICFLYIDFICLLKCTENNSTVCMNLVELLYQIMHDAEFCTFNFMMASFTMQLFLPFINLDFSFKTKTSCFCMNSMKSIYRQKLSCMSFLANTFYIGIKQVRFHIVNFKITDWCMQIINIWHNNIVMQMYLYLPSKHEICETNCGCLLPSNL